MAFHTCAFFIFLFAVQNAIKMTCQFKQKKKTLHSYCLRTPGLLRCTPLYSWDHSSKIDLFHMCAPMHVGSRHLMAHRDPRPGDCGLGGPRRASSRPTFLQFPIFVAAGHHLLPISRGNSEKTASELQPAIKQCTQIRNIHIHASNSFSTFYSSSLFLDICN